jgi:hypothetical protein
MPEELGIRLRIEKLCHRISKSLYWTSEISELLNGNQQATIINLLYNELSQVETDLGHLRTPGKQPRISE